jgi:hypothetical protein
VVFPELPSERNTMSEDVSPDREAVRLSDEDEGADVEGHAVRESEDAESEEPDVEGHQLRRADL